MTATLSASKKMTSKKPEKKTPKSRQVDVTVTPEQHVEAVKGFINTCMRVKYNKVGLPKSRQASDGAIAKVAEEAGGDEAAFSVGKRLLSCDHDVIDQINAWGRKVDKWRNTFTFSMAADDTADAGELKKARGERLIRKDDIDAFEKGLVEMEQEGLEVSNRLLKFYDQIMALEQKRLGKEFNQSDYPPKDKIVWTEERVVADPETGELKTVQAECGVLRIGRRTYGDVTASVRLPKQVLQRMTTQAAELMNQTVEVAVADITRVISETFLTLSKQLADRVRVRPPYSHPFRKQIDNNATAEVLAKGDGEGGKQKVTLAWKSGKQTIKADFEMTEAEFEELRPEPMEETKRLTTSVVDRLVEQLEVFDNLKSKLGVYGEHLDQVLDAIRDVIHKATGQSKQKATAVINNIKNSSFFRNTLKEELEGAVETMAAVATEAKLVRRKVHANVALQIAQASLKKKED